MQLLLGVCGGGAWRLNLCYGEMTYQPSRNLFLSHHLQLAPLYLLWPISQCQQGVRFLLGERGEGAWRFNLCHGELTCLHSRNLFLSHHLQPAPSYFLLAYLLVSAKGAVSTWSMWMRSLEIKLVLRCVDIPNLFLSHHLQPAPSYLPVSARGAVSTWSTCGRILEI